jgi:hypothetical protein
MPMMIKEMQNEPEPHPRIQKIQAIATGIKVQMLQKNLASISAPHPALKILATVQRRDKYDFHMYSYIVFSFFTFYSANSAHSLTLSSLYVHNKVGTSEHSSPYSPPDLNRNITEIFGKLINIYRGKFLFSSNPHGHKKGGPESPTFPQKKRFLIFYHRRLRFLPTEHTCFLLHRLKLLEMIVDRSVTTRRSL